MKLKQFKECRWKDTERLAKEEEEEKVKTMKAQGLSDDEIEEELKSIEELPPPPKPSSIPVSIVDKKTGETKIVESEEPTDSRFDFVAEYDREDAELHDQLSAED